MVNKQHKTISVCIFCGSQAGNDQDFAKMAADLGREMAQSRIGLVFGGGRSGLMGSISDSLLIHGEQRYLSQIVLSETLYQDLRVHHIG